MQPETAQAITARILFMCASPFGAHSSRRCQGSGTLRRHRCRLLGTVCVRRHTDFMAARSRQDLPTAVLDAPLPIAKPHGLPEQFRSALGARGGGCGALDSSTGSAERERKRLHARIEELDLELSVSDGVRLSDQLIQPLFGNRAVALVVDVDPVSI